MKATNKEFIDPGLAAKLKVTRESKGLTQEEVAKKARLTVTFYAMMERGEANPSIVKLKRVLKVLDLEILIK